MEDEAGAEVGCVAERGGAVMEENRRMDAAAECPATLRHFISALMLVRFAVCEANG